MLRVTPLYGSRWSPDGEAQGGQSTLVNYADCRVLLNVGWNANLPPLPDHEALVLTDSTLESIGGLPLYYRQWKEANQQDGGRPLPPIYATFPVVKMGQMTLYDQHAAISMDGGKPPFSLQDVDDAFSHITAIKFSHPQRIGPPGASRPTLTVTAHRAGHSVGGSFYVLQRLQDDTKVVMTAMYHIARELHLDSSTILQEGSAPDVLVTRPGGPALRAFHALAEKEKGQKTAPLPSMQVSQIQNSLAENVLSVLRLRQGNVLLPVDAASRSLELIYLLNMHWERNNLRSTFHLVWLGPMVPNTVEFARSQLEWMSTRLGQAFLDSQDGSKSGHHPWHLPNVRFMQSVNQLQTLLQESPNPTAVVASGLSLETGPARDVFLQWAENPDNAIIFTDSTQATLRRATSTVTSISSSAEVVVAGAAAPTAGAGATDEDSDLIGRQLNADEQHSKWTTAGQLLTAWGQAKKEGLNELDSVTCDVPVRVKQALQGAELKAFLAREEAARQEQIKEAKQQAILREVELAKGQLRLGEEDKSVANRNVPNASTPRKGASQLGRPRKKSRFDQSLFLKFSKPLHMAFEVREVPVGIGQKDSRAKYGIGDSIGRQGEIVEDDYGIAVLPEKFSDIVSGLDPSKFGSRVGEDVLRRGFGYGVTGPNQGKKGGPARVSEDEDDNGNTEMDEEALEALDLSEGFGIIRGRQGRPPSKVFTVWRKIEVLAEVSYMALEGRVGARPARQSITALQPREIIVLGGPAPLEEENIHDEVRLLIKEAHKRAAGTILAPSDGETAELLVGHAAYAVQLIDTPYVPPQKLQSMEHPPEPVEMYETKLGQCMVSKLDYVATGKKRAVDGSLVLAPRFTSSESIPSIYLSAGEVTLLDLRAELNAQGMKAEYTTKKGYTQIVVNGRIVVSKKQNSGQVNVEGPLCEDFWTVRRLVCDQYVIL